MIGGIVFKQAATVGLIGERQEWVVERNKYFYNDENEHLLPHRAVIKENSATKQKNYFAIKDCFC